MNLNTFTCICVVQHWLVILQSQALTSTPTLKPDSLTYESKLVDIILCNGYSVFSVASGSYPETAMKVVIRTGIGTI